MLHTQKLTAELEATRGRLAGYQQAYSRDLGAYRAALAALGTRYPSAAAIKAAQAALVPTAGQGGVSLGARPTAEYDAWRRAGGAGLPVLPFGRAFAHHEEARAWAEGVRGWTTLAVDGSQVLPWRDASLPVALVQAGLFENPHTPPTPYLKDVSAELLLPDDLLTAEPDTADARAGEALGYSTQVVHLRRFELEARTLIARMRHHAALAREGASRRVVAFCDGSLIVSFAVKMQPAYRQRYADAARALLATSEECRIPLVGYIDTSYARDIVTMLGCLQEAQADEALPEMRGIGDALLWQGALAWGDRTPAFFSERADLARMDYERDAVGFVYFQAALDRPPARLEFPRWLLEAGLLDDTLHVVRAEVIAGNGYPYSIEAADAAAVISAADRAQFYALFQQFAEREGLPFTFSRKALSKTRRRV
jgi:NurA domain